MPSQMRGPNCGSNGPKSLVMHGFGHVVQTYPPIQNYALVPEVCHSHFRLPFSSLLKMPDVQSNAAHARQSFLHRTMQAESRLCMPFVAPIVRPEMRAISVV